MQRLPYILVRRQRIFLVLLFIVLWVTLFSVSTSVSTFSKYSECAGGWLWWTKFLQKSGNSLGHTEPNSNNQLCSLFLDSETHRKRCSHADESLFCSNNCFLPPCGKRQWSRYSLGARVYPYFKNNCVFNNVITLSCFNTVSYFLSCHWFAPWFSTLFYIVYVPWRWAWCVLAQWRH